jgi:hypothetical protein
MLLRIQILSPPVVVEGGLCKNDLQISACRGGSSLQQRRNFNAVRACEIHEINSPTIFDRSRALGFLGRVFLHGHTIARMLEPPAERLVRPFTLVTQIRESSTTCRVFRPPVTPRNQKRPANSLRDGFIAEAALFNGMTLVTADRNLAAETGIFGAERVA